MIKRQLYHGMHQIQTTNSKFHGNIARIMEEEIEKREEG